MKNAWDVISEMNDEETGVPSGWSLQVEPDKDIFITKWDSSEFHVEIMPHNEVIFLQTCKSLVSAKRWVSMNLGYIKERFEDEF